MKDYLNEFQELVELKTKLRAKDGCPWDKEQTISSLMPKLMEETEEVLNAVRNKDYQNLAEELGDLLLNILLITQIAEEEQKFDLKTVIILIKRKVIRRHPHVFGNAKTCITSEEVVQLWNAIKKDEKKL